MPHLFGVDEAYFIKTKTKFMANFITRVELYGTPAENVYTTLHAAMIKNGFSRSFTEGGKSYDLPHAMYCLFKSSNTTTAVLELAKKAAATAWKDFSVLVTQTDVRFEHYNLKLSKL